MSKITTLNQLIGYFEAFADAHGQINDFGYGSTSEMSTSEQINYPLLWVTNASSSSIEVSRNKSVIPILTFQFIVLDQWNNQSNYKDTNGLESNNTGEIMSDTQQICMDIINYISNYLREQDVFIPDGSVTIEPAMDEGTDKQYGWILTLDLKILNLNCTIPGDFDNIIPPSPCDCDVASVFNSDGSYNTTVESGGSLETPDIELFINGVSQGFYPSVKDIDLPFTSMVVDFSVNNDEPDNDEEVQFTSLITGAVATEWYWDFGDGATSTLENPTHTYFVAGTYTVSLLAGNDSSQGDYEDKVDFITVSDAFDGVLWLDANDSSTLNGGVIVNDDKVNEWADKSVNGNDAIQGVSVSQPIYKDSGFGMNSRPYLTFDRTIPNFLDLGTSISKLPEHTVLIVQEFDTVASTVITLAEADGTPSIASLGIQIGQFSSANKLLLSAFSDGVNFSQTRGSTVLNASTPYIIANRYTNGDNKIDMFLDGVAESLTLVSTAATSIGGVKSNMILGKYGESFSSPFSGKVAEVKIWDRPLTPTELTSETNILKTKYGIS